MRGWKYLVVAVGMVIAGCAPEKPSEAVGAKDLEIEADGDDTLEDSEAVVARIDGEAITREEFDRRVDGLAEFARVRLQSADDREELLGRIAEFEVLADVAERKGYGASAEVRHVIKETMVALMVDEYLRDEVSMGDIDEEARRAYLEAHTEEFHRPERRRLARIVVDDEEAADEVMSRWHEDVVDADDRADEFRRFAFYYSEDRTTGDDGGIIGWFTAEEARREGLKLFDWEPEVVMGPRELDDGVAIEMVIDVDAEQPPVFEALEQQLTERVFAERRDEARHRLVEGLTADADVEVWDERIDELDEIAPKKRDVPASIQDIPLVPAGESD